MKEDILPTARLRSHSVVMTAREKAVVTGVNDIESFNENEIILVTDAGGLFLYGEELHINKLNLEEGQLVIDGLIDAMEYGESSSPRKKSLLSKLFR